MLSQIAVLLTQVAQEAHEEPAVDAWVVGAITLAILLAMLVAVVAFGGGREHS
jgi:hypothetical protein